MLLELLPHLKKILNWITLKRVIMLGLGGLVWIFSLTLVENRSKLYDSINDKAITFNSEQASLKVSNAAMKEIKLESEEHPELNFLMIISANLVRNQRDLTYWYTNNPKTELDIQDFIKLKGSVGMLLGQLESTDIEIIRTINGEFACYDNTNSIFIPALRATTKKICRVSIPPYFGEFEGYLVFGISKDIDAERLVDLRHHAIDITSEIYLDNLKIVKK